MHTSLHSGYRTIDSVYPKAGGATARGAAGGNIMDEVSLSIMESLYL